MTVIYSNAGDIDCKLLEKVWSNIEEAKVFEITPDMDDWEDEVDSLIEAEEDTLVLLGHGSSHGLTQDMWRENYIVHENNANLIKAKNLVCIWCNASSFCLDNKLPSISTSMFISNVIEAKMCGLSDRIDQDKINSSCSRFYDEVNHLLKNHISVNQWQMILGAHTDIDDEVDLYNRQGLYYCE